MTANEFDYLKEYVEKSHQASSQSISKFGAENKKAFVELRVDMRRVQDSILSLQKDLETMARDFNRLEASVNSFQDDYRNRVTPQINTWNNTAKNQSKVTWVIVSAVITAVLGAITFVL